MLNSRWKQNNDATLAVQLWGYISFALPIFRQARLLQGVKWFRLCWTVTDTSTEKDERLFVLCDRRLTPKKGSTRKHYPVDSMNISPFFGFNYRSRKISFFPFVGVQNQCSWSTLLKISSCLAIHTTWDWAPEQAFIDRLVALLFTKNEAARIKKEIKSL